MAHHRIDPPTHVPEEDFLDQHAPIETDELTGNEPTPGEASSAHSVMRFSGLADEADLLEQAMPLPTEEDYPHESVERCERTA